MTLWPYLPVLTDGLEPLEAASPGIRSLLAYLHHSHHASFEHLSCIALELFGLTISQDEIANTFAPKIRDHLRRAIRICKRRSGLKETNPGRLCRKGRQSANPA